MALVSKSILNNKIIDNHFNIKYGEIKSCHFRPYFCEKDLNFPIYLDGLGIRYPQEPRAWNKKNSLEHPAFFFCTEGKGNCILNGEHYEITPNTGIIQTPGMSMEYNASGNIFTTYFISVTGQLENSIFKYPNTFFHIKNIQYYLDAFYTLATLPFSNEWIYESSALLYKLILHLNDDIASAIQIDTKYEYILKPVTTYLAYNISVPYDSSDLSNILGITPTHLCRLFKLAYNITPGQYVQNLKINYAKLLLENHPNEKVSQIASACGYYDSAYFSAVFKKQTGLSPNEYRKTRINFKQFYN